MGVCLPPSGNLRYQPTTRRRALLGRLVYFGIVAAVGCSGDPRPPPGAAPPGGKADASDAADARDGAGEADMGAEDITLRAADGEPLSMDAASASDTRGQVDAADAGPPLDYRFDTTISRAVL